jgi:hypothetical protein
MRQKSLSRWVIRHLTALGAASFLSLTYAPAVQAQGAATGGEEAKPAKPPDQKTKNAARAAYGDGQKAFEGGDYPTAETKFQEANELARTMTERLAVPPPADGPRVLLVIGYRPGKLDEIWFIRDNSLHGAALRAAGARNAVPEAVSGLPRLSPERLLSLDPDAIFVLALPGKAQSDQLDGFRKLTPLRAVAKNQLAVIEAPEAYVHGPRIVALVDRLEAALESVARSTAP